ncbi:MAG TPA: sigma-70 family RNA polymerase sigma factor [Chloroflexota bacterium]
MESSRDETAALIRRAKEHDREAFAELYRATVAPVYRYVAARVVRSEETEDLTQEVFMAALRGIQGLRAEDESGLMAWLFQIARYKLADALRRKYQAPTEPLEVNVEPVAPAAGPEEAAETLDHQVAVRTAMDQLTGEQREVLICKYVLNYDNERTAQQVGKTANAVNQLHHRALRSLQRLLVEAGAVG